MKKLKCEWCGKEKEEISFYIGASTKPDWCMVEGTGKITCPNCYDKAILEAKIIKQKRKKMNEVNKLLLVIDAINKGEISKEQEQELLDLAVKEMEVVK